LVSNTVDKSGRKLARYLIAIILILSVILNVIQYSLATNSLAANQALQVNYNDLSSRYQTLYDQYQTLNTQFQTLSQEYAQLEQVALTPPYVSISKGTINWVFYDLEKNPLAWQMSIDSYREFVSVRKPVQTLSLMTAVGSTTTYDMRPYIQPSFFVNIISTLTEGRSAEDFVREVDNIKNQIVTYETGLGEAPYQFPAETLTEGRGRCADTTILMASMLIAGDRQANYGFNVYIWYVQANPDGTLVSDSKSITQANHAIVEVKFSDGTEWALETTTKYFYVYSQGFTGWQFDVTSTNK
jgi:transglutaminase-like putative cysteine protease